MKFLSKSEYKYILYAGIFSFIFFALIIPNALSYFSDLNPFLQFIIFNAGLLFFLQVFLKSITLNKKVKWAYSIGILILFIALDVIVPPLMVNIDGSLNTGVPLSQSSSDYIFAYIWQYLGISGFFLFIMTYVVTPIFLLFIASLLLKNFVKEI